MQYITKLATSQSQSETPVPPPPNYYIMYPIDAPVYIIVLKGSGQTAQPCKVPVNIYLYLYLLISVCPKTIKVYIYGDENSCPLYEDLQTLCMLFTSYITLGNDL
jgi:hypothetical protein